MFHVNTAIFISCILGRCQHSPAGLHHQPPLARLLQLHLDISLLTHLHYNKDYDDRSFIQLGQLSVIPPGLVLEAGGDFNLAGSYACKVEVPPHFKVPSGGDFSSPGMAAS